MASATAYVATQETTASTSFTDLATTTDSVTVNIGSSGCALVVVSASIGNYDLNTIAYGPAYAISGATTRAASDDRCGCMITYGGGRDQLSMAVVETGLNSGSTTFKMKYRQDSSTGYWKERRISVIPLDMAVQTAYVATDESTTSTTYTDLATTTDQVTVNITGSGKALVVMSCQSREDTAGAWEYTSYALSGANTRAADDTRRLGHNTGSYGRGAFGVIFPESGLTPGATTFKMKYRVSSSTGRFQYRRIAVIPL